MTVGFDPERERETYGYMDPEDDEDPGPHGGPANDTWEEPSGEDPDLYDGEDDD